MSLSGYPDQITLIEIPDPYNPIAEYPIAPVTGGSLDLATEFIAYVESPAGQQLLASRGFMAPTEAAAPH